MNEWTWVAAKNIISGKNNWNFFGSRSVCIWSAFQSAMGAFGLLFSLPWGLLVCFLFCHGAIWSAFQSIMGAFGMLFSLPWGHFVCFSVCHGAIWSASKSAMGAFGLLLSLPWGHFVCFSVCHGAIWSAFQPAMGAFCLLFSLPYYGSCRGFLLKNEPHFVFEWYLSMYLPYQSLSTRCNFAPWSIAPKPSLYDILRATGGALPALAIRAILYCWKHLQLKLRYNCVWPLASYKVSLDFSREINFCLNFPEFFFVSPYILGE